MLRWKIFVPMAIGLALLGMLGSKFWSASASQRQITALQENGPVEFSQDGGQVRASLPPEGSMAELLADLDPSGIESLLAGRNLVLQRTGKEPADAETAAMLDLILAEAAATGQYYAAATQLQALAKENGSQSSLVIWGDRLVAEIGDSRYSYIAQQVVGVSP